MAKQEKEKNNQKHFWRDFKAELKKVIWPTKKQLANNTLVVVAMVLVTTVIVLILDLAFEALNTYGINKIKHTVQDSISANVDGDEDNSENNNDEEQDNSEESNQETDSNNEENNQEPETNSEENNQTTEQE